MRRVTPLAEKDWRRREASAPEKVGSLTRA